MIDPNTPDRIADEYEARIAELRAELAAARALRDAAAALAVALREVLAAERFSSRAPETVEQAHAKLDRIKSAVVQAEDALSVWDAALAKDAP